MPGIDKLPIEETLEDSPQVSEAGSSSMRGGQIGLDSARPSAAPLNVSAAGAQREARPGAPSARAARLGALRAVSPGAVAAAVRGTSPSAG